MYRFMLPPEPYALELSRLGSEFLMHVARVRARARVKIGGVLSHLCMHMARVRARDRVGA